MQVQHVLLSVIGIILEIILGSVLKSIFRAYLGLGNEVYTVVLLNAA